jgi:hypothetical protein
MKITSPANQPLAGWIVLVRSLFTSRCINAFDSHLIAFIHRAGQQISRLDSYFKSLLLDSIYIWASMQGRNAVQQQRGRNRTKFHLRVHHIILLDLIILLLSEEINNYYY